jgi:hypothetical protein
LLEVRLQSIEMGCPEGAVRGQPVVERPEGLGAYPVQAALGVGAGLDETGLFEHPKVLRDGRLTELQVIDEVPDGTLSVPKKVEDGPPTGLTQDIEGGERWHERSILYQLYSCQVICGERTVGVVGRGAVHLVACRQTRLQP